MSRPTQAGSRPSSGNMAVNRQGSGAHRQSVGQLPSAGTRPANGQRSRPTAGQRPGTGNVASNRPNVGNQPGGRVTQGQLNDFLDLPGAGGARPSSRPSISTGWRHWLAEQLAGSDLPQNACAIVPLAVKGGRRQSTKGTLPAATGHWRFSRWWEPAKHLALAAGRWYRTRESTRRGRQSPRRRQSAEPARLWIRQ